MNKRWKLPVVAAGVCVSTILASGLARAASYDSPPALPAPTGTVVNVSTESQLQNAVRGATARTTIVIAPGTYNLTSTLFLNGVNDVTLRGATNNRDDVVLVGRGMTNANYGSVEFGVWTNGQRITIANLTIRDVYNHAIILNGGAQSPRIHNVHLVNTGQQFIKANPDGSGAGVNNGVVEYSVIEYSSASRDDYTNGVDVHTGSNWVVRNNLFRNIAAPNGALAGPAVLIWNGSRGATIEGNTFVNCQREISMGLMDRSPNDNSAGIVRNNFIVRRSGMYADVGVLVADSPGTQVLHNTILLNGTYPSAVEYRFSGSNGVVIANNLTSAPIRARDGASGTVTSNYLDATPSMFVNPGAGDLHLTASAGPALNKVAFTDNAPTDWDGQRRPGDGTADYGADEFGGGVTPPAPPPPTNQAPTVTLSGPGAALAAPATVTLSANATDADGSVSSVSFYNGTSLLGADANSPYTFSWSNVQAGTYSLVAVAVDNAGASTTSAPVSVTVGATSGLPSGWSARDIGSPAVGGSTSYASGTFTVDAGGVDVWDTYDQFRFVYQQVTGDVEIVARVVSLSTSDGWAKAGVMVREQLTPDSSHAMAVATAANGLAFQRRPGTGQYTTHTTGTARPTPSWVRLVRSGSTVSAYESENGRDWSLIGSEPMPMAATVYVGLMVTAHTDAASARATFTNVAVTKPSGNGAPSVTLTAPAGGATFSAPAAITLTATASDAGGSISRVDFYNGSNLIGSDASSPYSAVWNGVGAGTYSLTAVAIDNSGVSATSAAASVTVNGAAATGKTLVFNPSVDHASVVELYTVQIFAAGEDPTTVMTPRAAAHLGKPAPVNGTISVDITALIAPLPPGSYIASVYATGPGGDARGPSSNVFTR